MGFTKEDSNVQAAAGTKKITSFFGGKAKAKAPPADKENDENGGETKDHAVEEATPAGRKGEYLGPAKLKTALGRLRREARERLAASDAPPTLEEVERLLVSLEEWPTQSRPNVTDRKDGAVPGMCLGLVHALGGQGMKVSNISECFPDLVKLVVRYVVASLPETHLGPFPFSSLQVNYNYAAKRHVDGNNIGPSYILSMGAHTGGRLRTWNATSLGSADGFETLACHREWALFDGCNEHETEPFAGTRISFIAFTHMAYNKLPAEVAAELRELGFTAASSDGVDDPFFQKFRIDRSELAEGDRQKYCQYREKRRAERPPPSGPGWVAVECNGYSADRGHGWFSFVGKRLNVQSLPRNTTGFWVMELRVREAGIFLKHHQLFDLYSQTARETARFCKYVDALPDGAAVLICICDTACAASRPLGREVYAALRALGAPAEMDPIGYRCAFSLIGFKGCAAGDAVMTMGKRQTMVRLEARLALNADGRTLIAERAEDSTNISDVILDGEGAADATDADGGATAMHAEATVAEKPAAAAEAQDGGHPSPKRAKCA